MASPATEGGNPLNALADVAANLFISLPDSPQGKPFIDRAEAGSPAALLRAMRKRLNLTQREFGILLSPAGGSPISPSVICQLESALQAVPPPLVSRAVAATTAAQRLGEFLCNVPESKASDAASALKSLGPGCIEELQPYLDGSPSLAPEEATLVQEFLAIVTKRRHSTGGSRPGARVSDRAEPCTHTRAAAAASPRRGAVMPRRSAGTRCDAIPPSSACLLPPSTSLAATWGQMSLPSSPATPNRHRRCRHRESCFLRRQAYWTAPALALARVWPPTCHAWLPDAADGRILPLPSLSRAAARRDPIASSPRHRQRGSSRVVARRRTRPARPLPCRPQAFLREARRPVRTLPLPTPPPPTRPPARPRPISRPSPTARTARSRRMSRRRRRARILARRRAHRGVPGACSGMGRTCLGSKEPR